MPIANHQLWRVMLVGLTAVGFTCCVLQIAVSRIFFMKLFILIIIIIIPLEAPISGVGVAVDTLKHPFP